MSADLRDDNLPHVLERIDAGRGMFRYYALSLQPTLFDEISLVREWGRIGRFGGRRIALFANAGLARTDFEKWLRRKRHRGYVARDAVRE